MIPSITLPVEFRCGYFDCSVFGELTRSPLRKRSVFEIEFYLENGKTTYSDGNAYRIKKHHVLIGRPGESCNSELPFKTKFLKLAAEGVLAERLSALPSYFPVLHPFEIERHFDRLIALHMKEDGDPLSSAAALLSLLSALIEDGMRTDERADSAIFFVEHAKGFIRAHHAEGIRLSDVAASVNLSPSYFHSLFTETVGMTPHDYLLDCRLGAAREMLCATSVPIDEIARQCGFGSQQYMANVFRKRLGISPGKCRRTHRESYLQ